MKQFDFIAEKHAAGATIMETIKAVMNGYGIGLGESKYLVSSHPVWATVVKAAQTLHRELGSPSAESVERK